MAEIRGVVQDVIYTNEQTGYSVLELETEGSLSLVVTGNIPLPGNGYDLIPGGGDYDLCYRNGSFLYGY